MELLGVERQHGVAKVGIGIGSSIRMRSFHYSDSPFESIGIIERDMESLMRVGVRALVNFFCSHSVVVSTTDFESVILGSNPSESSYNHQCKMVP